MDLILFVNQTTQLGPENGRLIEYLRSDYHSGGGPSIYGEISASPRCEARL